MPRPRNIKYAVSETGKKRLANYNISVGKRRTSVRLSPATHKAIANIAAIENCDPRDVFEFIARTRETGVSVSTAIRDFAIRYFLEAGTVEGHSAAGHGSLIKLNASGPTTSPGNGTAWPGSWIEPSHMSQSDLANIGQLLYGEQWKAELGRHLGVSRTAVGRWANGTHRVPEVMSEKLRQLAWGKYKELEKLFVPASN
jgi:hypothetical protein